MFYEAGILGIDTSTCILNELSRETNPELYGPDPDTDYYHRLDECATTATQRPPIMRGDCEDEIDIMFVVDGSGSVEVAEVIQM